MSASGWVLECSACSDPEPANCAGFILLIVQVEAPQPHLRRSCSREQQFGMEDPFPGWMSKHWCTSALLALQPAQPAFGIQGLFTLLCWGEKLLSTLCDDHGWWRSGKNSTFYPFYSPRAQAQFLVLRANKPIFGPATLEKEANYHNESIQL